MKSFSAPFDFEKYKAASKSKVAIFILIFALLFTSLAVIVLIQQAEKSHPAIAAILTFSTLVWAVFICLFIKTRKNLILSNLQREKAEKALLRSEAHFRELFENANDMVYTTNLKGDFKSFNKMGERLIGYTEKEACTLNFLDIVAPEYLEITRQNMRAVVEGKNSAPCQIELIGKDGKRAALEISNRLICENGAPAGIQGIARDIGERKKLEAELAASEERYRAFIKRSSEGIWRFDFEHPISSVLSVDEQVSLVVRYGYLAECNDVMAQMYGFEKAEEMRGKRLHELLILSDASNYEVFNAFIAGSYRLTDAETHEADAAGNDKYFLNNLIGIVEDGNLVSAWGTQRDITDRRRANEALHESEYKLRSLLESMNEGLVQVDSHHIIEFVNDRFCEMTGYTREELIRKADFGAIFLDEEGRRLIAEADEERLKGLSGHYEVRLKKKNGEILYMIVGGAPIINAEGAVVGSMGVFTDITERKRAEEKLIHDAFYDSLTGLANRMLFVNHLQMTIARGGRDADALYAVLFLDFDRFKVINDSLGHAEGDRLLQQVARRLESSVRACDLVARLGGDEFTVLLTDLQDPSDAVMVADRIQNNLRARFDLGGGEVFMSASIGITLSSVGHQNAEEMLRDADIAMYRAKAKGRAQYQLFDREMHKHAMSQLKLETELRQALEREEFRLFFQPIVNLETAAVVGFEALIRWQHPSRGLIMPGEFIPAAEENGLILPIGWWILGEACRRMREWQIENLAAQNMTISVNLSSKQFLQYDLADRVAEKLIMTGLDAQCLKLEITESHVMENSEMAVTMMNRLRALGVELSLDDFGTGYSSLSYLHRLPVSTLKIDRTFVSRMTDSQENAEIVYTVIKLAQNLKMKVVAEGIETGEQLEKLKRFGCELGQGFFFSQPLEAEAAWRFIKEESIPNSFLRDVSAVSLKEAAA